MSQHGKICVSFYSDIQSRRQGIRRRRKHCCVSRSGPGTKNDVARFRFAFRFSGNAADLGAVDIYWPNRIMDGVTEWSRPLSYGVPREPFCPVFPADPSENSQFQITTSPLRPPSPLPGLYLHVGVASDTARSRLSPSTRADERRARGAESRQQLYVFLISAVQGRRRLQIPTGVSRKKNPYPTDSQPEMPTHSARWSRCYPCKRGKVTKLFELLACCGCALHATVSRRVIGYHRQVACLPSRIIITAYFKWCSVMVD
jgi:hypothetical protein